MRHFAKWLGLAPLLLLGLASITTNFARADDRFETIIDVPVEGKPEGIGTSERPQYFVWHDEQGWHVHTDTGGKVHAFNIVVETVGGRIVKLTGLEALERNKKKNKTKAKDRGTLSADRRRVTAEFRTVTRTDGIDFTVDANTSAIRLRLLIDGEERPAMIALGRGKTAPKDAVFALANKPK